MLSEKQENLKLSVEKIKKITLRAELNPSQIERLGASAITPYLLERIESLYHSKQELAYHSWEHIKEVRKNCSKLAIRCKKFNIEVDEVALDHAALCHDLLYTADPIMLGFAHREELAAVYTANLLIELGCAIPHAKKVSQIILATHHDYDPQTTEEKLMRAADLSGLALNYKSFLKNTLKLYEEASQLGNRPESFSGFCSNSIRFLSSYLMPNLELTPNAINKNGVSKWHGKVIRNLVKLFRETRESDTPAHVTLVLGDRWSDVIHKSYPKASPLFILVASDIIDAKLMKKEVDSIQCYWEQKAPVLITLKDKTLPTLSPSIIDETIFAGTDLSPYQSLSIMCKESKLIS